MSACTSELGDGSRVTCMYSLLCIFISYSNTVDVIRMDEAEAGFVVSP